MKTDDAVCPRRDDQHVHLALKRLVPATSRERHSQAEVGHVNNIERVFYGCMHFGRTRH